MVRHNNRRFADMRSQSSGIDPQTRVRQLPKFLEALQPGTNVGGIVKNQCAARLIDMEATYSVALVGEDMGIGQIAQVVGALAYVDDVRKAKDQLPQALSIAFQWFRVVQHDADPAQGILPQKAFEDFEA